MFDGILDQGQQHAWRQHGGRRGRRDVQREAQPSAQARLHHLQITLHRLGFFADREQGRSNSGRVARR